MRLCCCSVIVTVTRSGGTFAFLAIDARTAKRTICVESTGTNIRVYRVTYKLSTHADDHPDGCVATCSLLRTSLSYQHGSPPSRCLRRLI